MNHTRSVLIIGGAGLIGKATAELLLAQGARVTIADIAPKRNLNPAIHQHTLNILKKNALAELIEKYQPDIIINAINVATLFSHNTKIGYGKIIAFYIDLYRSLRALNGSIHYIQVGTTGSGGLGFNIPFTHGDTLEELPIINKAAFAGITTSMLTLLSRSFSDHKVRISEIKPGLAIFADQTFASQEDGVNLITLDGGESGHYTYNETALLTQFMGFTVVSRIAQIILDVCEGRTEIYQGSAHDIIENLNKAVISEKEENNQQKIEFLARMKEQQGSEYVIATGNLGPPSITRDLILGQLLSEAAICESKATFQQCLANNTSIKGTFAYIKRTNPKLSRYLRRECSFYNYQLLKHYYRKGAEPWQIAGASLSKLAPVY